MEVWIKPSDNLSESKFVLTFHNSDRRNLLLFGISKEGQMALNYNTGKSGEVDFFGTTIIPVNEWTHIALTIESNNNATVYINGNIETLIGEDVLENIPIRPVTNGYFSIGQDFDGSNITNDFIGQIDEVRVWNTVRSQEDIRANMFKELLDIEGGLTAYYNFNDGSGTSLADTSINTNSGTLVNSPTWKTSGAFSGPRNALVFDGVDDFIPVTDNTIDLSSDFTLDCWINSSVTDVKQGVLSKQSTKYGTSTHSRNYEVGVVLQASGVISLYLGDNSGNWRYSSLSSISLAPINTWTHVAAVVDGTEMRLYLNGKLESTKKYTYSRNLDSGQMRIGAGIENNDPFHGMLDEVRIWNKALTAVQICNNMI